ncbi:hypothetical protein [uncultured Thiohalocapsa sp.]|uniref:hypothetical protein n=1 Tax=uncultured Thiohalocapsa sp. TaxID=768990 RepID=UPI0025DEED31|nr:hypothetical protein [uncultured Thiohalocapsa sp.]
MPSFATVLPAAATLLLVACAQPPERAERDLRPPAAGAAGGGSRAGEAGAGAARRSADTLTPLPGRAAGDLVTTLPGAELDPIPGAGATTTLPDGDEALRQAVAARCASRPDAVTEASMLSALVAELQADGVAPAAAVDALILGGCGDLADIVTDVVARNGADAAVPVIDRAVALTGDTSALIVERAAAEGLLRAGRERVAAAGGVLSHVAGTAGEVALMHFPPGGDSAGATAHSAGSLAQLIGSAEPGYGLYTFVLFGGGGEAGGVDAAGWRELLRVIETYVLAADPAAGAAHPAAHTFVVPVDAGRTGVPLAERTGPVPSADLRRTLAAYLRRAGEPALAARLATAPGPFLVSTLEPRLVPGSPQQPRMIVDLSRIGPEYMYTVVDAYDREVPPAAVGRVDSLLAVRGRLMGMVPDPTMGSAAPPPAGDWVFMLGGHDGAQAAALGTARPPGLRPAAPHLAAVQRGR